MLPARGGVLRLRADGCHRGGTAPAGAGYRAGKLPDHVEFLRGAHLGIRPAEGLCLPEYRVAAAAGNPGGHAELSAVFPGYEYPAAGVLGTVPGNPSSAEEGPEDGHVRGADVAAGR